MTWITYRPNVADKRKDQLIYAGSAESVNEALERAFGEKKPTEPFVVQVNGVPFLRADWEKPISADSSLEVLVAPGDVATGVLTALTVASLLVTAYAMTKVARLSAVAMGAGASVPDAPPSFTFAGQKNIQRLNNTLDCVFGRVRWWPAYLCAPYVLYKNNKPTLFAKLSLGLGNFDIEQTLVHDTPLGNVVGSSATQYACGAFTASGENYDGVYYASEVNNNALLAPDEEGHEGVGPYKLNPSDSSTSKIVLNFNYGSGLFSLSGSTYTAATVELRCVLTELNAEGVATGRKQSVTFSHTAASKTALRITEVIVPDAVTFSAGTGRYAIYAIRTSAKNAVIGAQDSCSLASAFALCASGTTYSSITVLEVKLPGTSTVGSDASEKLNVVATRKLQPIVDGVLSTEVATTNPAWAAVYALTSSFGAGTPSADLDLTYWEELAREWQLREFSYRFEQETTVWDVLEAIAVATRSGLYRVGMDARFSPISPVKKPVALYTPDTAMDLELNFGFKTSSENDCIEAAYIDTTTGLQDSVFFTPPGSTASNPSKVTYAGVTNRQEAWRLAAYDYMVQTIARDTARFTVGLDGQIPLRGDVVLVSWPFPSWDASGVVVSAVIDGAGLPTLTLSDDVPYEDGWLSLRKSNGATWGPVKFTRTAARTVTSTSSLNFSFDFSGETREPIAYTLGTDTIVTKRFSVTETALSDDDLVTIEAEEFSASVFGYDTLPAPSRGMDMLPYSTPVTAGVPWVRILDESGQFLRAEVGPVFGLPDEIGIQYLFVDYASVPAAALLVPDYYATELDTAPEAEQVGAAYYIPRSTGVVFLRVKTIFGFIQRYLYFRTFVGDFGMSASYPVHAILVNNCDGYYLGPADSHNAPGANGLAQASIKSSGMLGRAVFDVNEKQLILRVDCPPDAQVHLEVIASDHTGTQLARLDVVATDSGDVVVPYTALKVSGVLDTGTETQYPCVRLLQWADGREDKRIAIDLDIKPLVSSPVQHTLELTPLGYSSYAEGSFYDFAAFTYTNFATYFSYAFLGTVLNAFTGTVRYKFEERSQSLGGYTTRRTMWSSTPETTLQAFRQPHLDSLANFELQGAVTHFKAKFRLDGADATRLRAGNVLHVLILREDLTALTAPSIVGSIRTAFLLGPSAYINMRDVPSDVLTDFSVGVYDVDTPTSVRELTADECALLSAEAKFIVFPGFPSYEELSTETHPTSTQLRGSATLYDMFGYKGNESSGIGNIVEPT